MSELPVVISLNDADIIEFTALMPAGVRVLTRFVLWDRRVSPNTWSFARLLQKREPKNELVEYVANWDPARLEEVYANVMEDVLNDQIEGWRSGTH
jgi:hypothetical protein